MSSLPRSSDRPLAGPAIEDRLDAALDAVLSSRRTASGIASRLAGEPRAIQEFVLHWTARVAASSAELGYQFASLGSRAVALLGTGGAEAWLVQAMDVFDREGLYAASAKLKDLDGFASQVGGVAFDQVAGHLELFVCGLSGRRMRVEKGEHAGTDTETVFLPERVGLLRTEAENRALYRTQAALLWAQARFGTYSLAADAYPQDATGLAWLNALEALRLRACVQRVFPGLARDLERGMTTALDPRVAERVEGLAAPEAGVADSLALARAVPADALPPAWPFLGRLDPARAAAVREARILREKAAFRNALARLRAQLGEQAAQDGAADAGDSAAGTGEGVAEDRSRRPLRVEAEEAGDGDITVEVTLDGKPVAPNPDVVSLAQSIVQDLGGIPDDYLTAAGEGPYRPAGEASPAEDAERLEPERIAAADTVLYDEWDCFRGHYRKNWCVLREFDVHPGDPAFVPAALARHKGAVYRLRRSFEALRGEDKLQRREPHGDDLDLDAVIAAFADVRGGAELPARLFVRRQKTERNMAVMFMVDMSGSTKGWINDAEREALVMLCEALEILGDRYAIYGFSGITCKRCEIYRVKRFDERYDDLVRQRIAGIIPLDYTRMGVAIRHLTRLLDAEDARTKLLVTLSDGKPDDYSDGYRGEYGIEDTRRALIEAKRRGIHPFCITIDREANDYLPRMYGPVNYAVVDDVAKLPLKVADIYRRLTS